MKYCKKPIIIDAYKPYEGEIPDWFEKAIENKIVGELVDGSGFNIATLEGIMHANPGDYIIRGINGEIYPCKPDIFLKTYSMEIDKKGITFIDMVDKLNCTVVLRKGDIDNLVHAKCYNAEGANIINFAFDKNDIEIPMINAENIVCNEMDKFSVLFKSH